MSRYAALARYLEGQRSDRVTLSFGEVEDILGGTLPASARTHRAWWANDTSGRVQAEEWLNAGWETEEVSLTGQHVTFVRA